VQPSAHKYTDKGFIRMVRKFIRYYKPHKKLFLIDMLCAFIVALCDLFYPIIAKDIINDYVPSQNLRMLLIWAGVLLGIYALKALLNYIIQYWGHVVGVRMQGDMRRDMFRRLQRLPFSFYDENKTGAVMSRLVNDLFDVSELAHHGPEDLFLSAIMLVGSFVMLATIDIWLTVIVFAFLPFIVLFAVKTRREMNRAFKKAREEIAEINANLETSISGIRIPPRTTKMRALTAPTSDSSAHGATPTALWACSIRAPASLWTCFILRCWLRADCSSITAVSTSASLLRFCCTSTCFSSRSTVLWPFLNNCRTE